MSSLKDPSRSMLRVVAALRPGDQSVVGGLVTNGCVVVGVSIDSLDRTVGVEHAGAVLVDAELPGAFDALLRVRKLSGLAGTVPIALVGPADKAIQATDFLHRHGPGFFMARPLSPAEVALRLRALSESGLSQQRQRVMTMPPVALPKTTPQPFAPRPPSPASTPSATPMLSARRPSPAPFASPSFAPVQQPSITPVPGALTAVSASVAPFAVSGASHDNPLASAASPALRPGVVSASMWAPPSLASPLSSLLRNALTEAGGSAEGFELPPAATEELDDLIPPELLEPLDAPFDALAEDAPDNGRTNGPSATSPGVPARRTLHGRSATASGLTPLPVDGDLRLAGALGRYGVPLLLAAAGRVRATGVLFVQSRGAQWQVALHAGHVLAVRGSRAEDLIGPLLARLGFLPQEAVRFAELPLDLGVRGAALLAARGYVAPDGVAPMLARAAQEVLFDLFSLDAIEWEIRAPENSVGIPMQTRAPDALLVFGARARVEPVAAFNALGGDGTSVTLRAEPSAIASLPLTAPERAAALAARESPLGSLVRAHGEQVLPALLALYWLQHLRVEGGAREAAGQGTPGPERTRLRALFESARRKDLLAMLGVSPFATRSAALIALDVRRAEVDAIRARNPTAESLPAVSGALDDLTKMLQDAPMWERYTAAVRSSSLREE